MPAKLERCVADLDGKTNPRTKKPYTQSEKYAICNAAIKRGHDKSNASLESHVLEILDENTRKLLSSGRAKTLEEAQSMAEALLAKSDYDVDMLQINFTRM